MMQKPRFICNKSDAYPSIISTGTRCFTSGELHVKRIFPAFVALFVYEGTLHMQEGSKEYDIKAGQWLILSPHNLHYGYKPSRNDVRYYWVHFMPNDSWRIEIASKDISAMIRKDNTGGGVYKSQFSMNLPMSGSSNVGIYETLESLVKNYDNSAVFSAEADFLKLLELLIGKKSQNTTENILTQEIIIYIVENFTKKDFSLKEVAEKFNFTRQYITRLLQKNTNLSFSQHLMDLRIQYAKNHLLFGGKTVSQIANDIGYDDMAVFSRMFKKHVGLSPRNFALQEKNRFLKLN